MIRRENASCPNKLSSSEIGKLREIVGHFLSRHPTKYLSDAEVASEIRGRLHEKATPERAQQAIDFAIENYHYEIERYEREGGRKRNPPMLILGNPPKGREPFPYSSPHGIGSWSPPLPQTKPVVKSLKPRFDPSDPSWEKRRERVSPSLAMYLMPMLKSLGASAIYNPADETVYIHRGFKALSMGKFNTLDDEISGAFDHANRELKFARKYEPKKISDRAFQYSREPVRVNRGGPMRGRNPRVQPPGSGKRFWPKLPPMPDSDDPDGDIDIAKRVGWLPVWTDDQELEYDDKGKPLPRDPGPMRAYVRKLDDNGQYYDIDDDGSVWVYVGQQKDSTGGERAWKKRLNDVYHALGQPLRFPDVEPGGSQTRGRMMNPFAADSGFLNTLYVVTEEDIEEWQEQPCFPFREAIGMETQKRQGYEIEQPEYKGWRFVEEHFVDSSGFGARGEAALTVDQFVDKLVAGHGYILTGIGQFQVKVSEYRPASSSKRKRNPLDRCEREFARGHVEAHREDAARSRSQFLRGEISGHEQDIDRFSNPKLIRYDVFGAGVMDAGEEYGSIWGPPVYVVGMNWRKWAKSVAPKLKKLGAYADGNNDNPKYESLDYEFGGMGGDFVEWVGKHGKYQLFFDPGEMRKMNPLGGRGEASEDDARELELYIDNDEQIYNSRFIPIVKNLMKKWKKGVYDHALSVKLWMYLVDDAAREYIREFGSEGSYVFTKPTRLLAAERYATSFEQDAAAGEYDHLLVEPKRTGTKVHAEGFPLEDFYTDLGMHEKNYRYKVAPRSGAFEPLYAKDTHQVAEIMRMYPNELFNVFDMKEKRKENRGRRR